MYVPKLFVGIGATQAYFTLRETYEHKSHTPGYGDMGRAVVNGVYQGSVSVEIRSFHHQNLSQDADEAFEKAKFIAEQMALELVTTKEQMVMEMREIQRASAEDLAERERRIQIAIAENAEAERQRIARMEEAMKNGVIPFGRYRDVKFADAPVGYINWLMTATFDTEMMIKLQAAVIAQCEHLRLPTPSLTATVAANIGERVEFKNVVVTRVASFGSDWGVVFLITMVTTDGICLLAKGSFKADVGDRFDIKATINTFSEYKGQAQTVVNRVKVVVDGKAKSK